MRLGKPTRLEREMQRRIIQEHAEKWMTDRGYEPEPVAPVEPSSGTNDDGSAVVPESASKPSCSAGNE